MDQKARIHLLLFLLSGLCGAHPRNDPNGDDANSVDRSEEDISTTILRMNNGSMDTLYEGDLFIPKTRNALKCLNKRYSCFWQKSPNGNVEIPFILSDQYDENEKSKILAAMKGFEPKTCIRFVPRTAERAYLSIEPKYGCFSLLGQIGDKQIVSLQRFGCVDYGIIQHELLHALGFYHEHTRSDRDQYVRINWDNIKQYYLDDFKKMDTDNLNTRYDYSSVMHYGRTAFGTGGKETIIPIPDPSVQIGQRQGMSDIDILRVNILYKCN